MNPILLVVVGVALGIAIGWLLAANRSRTELVNLQVSAEGRVKTAEGTLQELRARLDAIQAALAERERDLSGFQQKLREESDQKVRAQTELENARAAVTDSLKLRELLRNEGELRVAAETKLLESQANLEEQKKVLEDARKSLLEAFKALSAEALKNNNETFITLANSRFETLQAQAKGELETRQKAIDGLVNPLKESLGRYELQILEMEKTRQKAYGTLDEQLRTLAQANQRLEDETKNLRNALSSPLKARGRWGS